MKKSLTMKTKIGFGIGDLGGNLFFTMMGFYLMFYLTDSVGLSAGYAGTALMIGKIWDAVTDPMVGYLSDRTRSPMGRRRPFILAGSISLFFAMILMFTEPPVEGQIPLFLVVTFLYCVLNTAFTIVNIPYGALLPELSEDFNERTLLTGYRMSFAVVGTFIGAGAVRPLIALFGGGSAGWSITGGIMGLIMLITAMITFLTIREPVHNEVPARDSIFQIYLSAFKSRPFVLALIPWTMHTAGVTMIQGAMLYYFKYIFGKEDMFQFALLFLLATSLLFIPVWVRISKSIGKKRAYNYGMSIFGAVVLLFFFFAPSQGPVFAVILMALAGTGFATHYVMPHSIVPDVVECDYADTGRRREGIFYGMWTFCSKLGNALALAINGWVLSLVGYIPDQPQSDLSLFGIRLLVGPLPVLFIVIGITVLSFYPVTRQYYAKVLETIAKRKLKQ